jgi:cell division protein FtsZ
VTVIAAGFEGGVPKRVSVPVLTSASLNGQADPIPSNDPISVAMDAPETTRRRITFEELVAEDDIDVPDFMK